ncbi:MAG: hypothetical protein R3192_13815 [Woeseiaceae bacterium]|nr:hypothetical protein [Woeseiaceae bacterium]
MNWEAIGAIGEILAAIAVIVTLIYLAKQIQLNARTMEVTALRDTTEHWHRWSEALATSSELAEIVARGNKSFDDLPENEAMRYGAYAQMFFDSAESYRSLVLDHKVQKDLGVLESIVAKRVSEPGIREWWSQYCSDYDAGYVEWINGIISRSEDGGCKRA